jgi:L-threonylcarbamoyladenylate synthase
MNEIERAAGSLHGGGVVAFPTETVYGLGADARNENAVRRVFAIKGRPVDHPLIVHLAEAAQAGDWAADIPETARRLMARFWPGPLTLVLPARDDVPRAVTGGQDSVALRAPNHPMALALLRAFGGGLAAPSANRFGAVSPTEARHVRASLGDVVDQVLNGGPCRYGLESTIVSLLDESPQVLRPGALPLATLRNALSEDGIKLSDRTTSAPRVPGALVAHYAPVTPLEIHSGEALATRAEELLAQGLQVAVLLLNRELHGNPISPSLPQFLLPTQPVAYARGLYARLHEIDYFSFDRLLVEAPPKKESWGAVNDRLERASVRPQGPWLPLMGSPHARALA